MKPTKQILRDRPDIAECERNYWDWYEKEKQRKDRNMRILITIAIGLLAVVIFEAVVF